MQGGSALLRSLLLFSLIVFFVGAAGGATEEGGPAGIPDDMDRESLRVSIRHSLDYLARVPGDRVVGKHPRKFTAEEVGESLHAFKDLLDLWDKPEIFFKELYSRFDLYPSSTDGAESNVLVTGYYQPLIEAWCAVPISSKEKVRDRQGSIAPSATCWLTAAACSSLERWLPWNRFCRIQW